MTAKKKFDMAAYEAKRDSDHKKWLAKQARERATAQKALEREMKKVKVPEGFTAAWGPDDHGQHVYKMTGPANDIEFIFRPFGGGTTRYKAPDGSWRTFDRTGVEDSFYWQPFTKGEKVNFDEIFTEQFRRIAERLEFFKTAVKVPDLGYSISPDRHAQIKADLKKGKHAAFHPSGFGTGYNLVTKPPRQMYGVKRATPALETFFDHSPLWLASFDAD